MIPILTGQFLITDNRSEVMNMISSNAPNLRVMDLEEEASLPLDHPMVVNGIPLLPPVDSIIAEQDGNAQAYFGFYYDRLGEPEQEDFMTAIICYLCNGGIMIGFVPDLKFVMPNMLRRVLDARYGIRIGMYPMEQTLYNYDYAHIWLWKMYTVGFIDAKMYLKLFPVEQHIPDYAISKLIYDTNIYGTDYNDKVQTLERIKDRMKVPNRCIVPVYSIASKLPTGILPDVK